jgi:subtilase family serine protease
VERIYSPQHRGNEGEGQFHVRRSNIQSLDKYLTEVGDIEKAIEREYENEMRLRPKGCAKITKPKRSK